MKPCKHLDHDPSHYDNTVVLRELDGFKCPVKYFERVVVPYDGAVRKVQFCGAGRGRINGIFQCYNPGEMHCYEPVADEEER
jgi:hypothetical protein